MAKAIYNLKIQLLNPQLTYQITAGQQKEVKRMAEFVSIFYSVWFLRSSLPSAAPNQDVKAFWQMVQYRKYMEVHHPESERVIDGIMGILDSMRRHTWYLDETLIPLALLDPDMDQKEQQDMTEKLHFIQIPF